MAFAREEGWRLSFKRQVRDIFRQRELLLHLAIKDLKVRYKRLGLGFLWAMLSPMVRMGLLWVIFTRFIPIIDIPHFPVYLLCALFPWTFLELSLSTGVTSLVDNSHLLKKVYFPREVVPLAVVLANLLHFVLSLFIVVPVAAWECGNPGVAAFALPLLIAVQCIFISGVVLLASALHAGFRDVKYIVELALMAWFWATPIFYRVADVEKNLPRLVSSIYMLNPMAGLVTMYRDVLMNGILPDWGLLGKTAAVSAAAAGVGLAVFRRTSGTLADVT